MSHDLSTTAGKIADFRQRREEAAVPSGQAAVDKQHARGKNTARERIEMLLDPDSFVEFDALREAVRRFAEAEIAPHIAAAVAEAEAEGIGAKAVTPFLLDRLYQLTEGRSLGANIALVLNNARFAAAIAREFGAAPG